MSKYRHIRGNHVTPETTLDWMNKTEMWKDGLTLKELYIAAKNFATFGQLIEIYPLSIVQKRGD